METYPWRFWGCVASAGQPYLFAPDDTNVLLDVSQATLIADDTTTARHHLFCEIEGSKYHLCSFVPGKIEHHMLSGSFHNDVKFYVTGGKCEVSILGRVKIIPDVYREPPDTMMLDPEDEEDDDIDDETARNTLLNAMNNAPITQQRLDLLMGMPSKQMEVPDNVQPLNLASIMQAAISQAGGDDEDDDDDEDFVPGEDDEDDTTMGYDSDDDEDDSNEDDDDEDEDADEEDEDEDEGDTKDGAAKIEGKGREPDSDSSADYGPPVPKELQQKQATSTPAANPQTPQAATIPALAANGKKLSAKQMAEQLHAQPATAPRPIAAPTTQQQKQAPATAPKPSTQQKQKEATGTPTASTPQQKGKGSKKK